MKRVPAPLRSADLSRYDAVLFLRADDALLATLPHAASLRQLFIRTAPRPGTPISVHLPNKTQTLAVIGQPKLATSVFEQHQFAGRAVRETLKAKPQRVLVWGEPRPENNAALEGAVLALLSQSFGLPKFQSNADPKPRDRQLRQIEVVDYGALDLANLTMEANAQNLARWLTALPPNKLDAKGYVRSLRTLARRHGLRFSWLGEKQLRRLGAGAFLAVAAGNARRDAAGIARLSYRPRKSKSTAKPALALVGKGILFDTGGTNLKPHRSMLDMHIDMAGSAVALATIIALAQKRAPVAIDAWLAITENRIGPTAYMPQQVVTAVNGTTIQVIHTDAEGRMALADTLALAGRSGAGIMIDYATLTGAAVYALTERMSALLGNNSKLTNELMQAAAASGERLVAFPLEPDFDSDLESKVADVMQCTVEGKGDQMLAAHFLQRFVPKGRAWAHIDLSAAQRSGGLGLVASDITGFGVRLTLRWFQERFGR